MGEGAQDGLGEAAGNPELLGKLEHRRGAQPALEALAEARHQAQGHKFPAALVHVVGQPVLQIERPVFKSVGDFGAEEQDDPGQIDANHEDRHQAQAAVEIQVGHDAGDEQESENIVQVPERAGDRAAHECGGELHPGVREQLIDEGERQPQHQQRQQGEDEFPDERGLDNVILGGLELRAAGQPQGGDEQQRAQQDGGGIELDLRQPIAPPRDAPNVVEGLLDAAEQRDGHENEQHRAGGPEPDGLGLLHKAPDVAGDLLLGADGDHRARGVGPGGGRGGNGEDGIRAGVGDRGRRVG